uniref:cathepsin L1-like n=1 Tax=Maylandia zebra TaxID=106582 RepID=UPI000D2F735F|nr:cathepsin L1-like [Maylandia zebra]
MKLLLVVSAVLAVSSCASISLEDLEFHAWKLKFEKSYDSELDEAHRKQVWLNNRKFVLMHNILADQGLKSYRLGMTHFADMDHEEYKQLVSQGCLHTFNASLPQRGSTFLGLPEGTDLPDTVDWRDKGYVTEVKDQKQCGSCWAFSTTGVLEGQHFRKTGKLVSLSEQQLMDCSHSFGNNGCKGGSVKRALQYIQANGGIDTETAYPYKAKGQRCRYKPDGIGAKCTGYVHVKPSNEETLKKAVATIGPISVGIDASRHSFQFYQSGVYNDPDCSKTVLDHGVLAVGYGTENGHDYWLIKNSWGHRWGDKGYIKMSRNKSNQCGIASQASYPLV